MNVKNVLFVMVCLYHTIQAVGNEEYYDLIINIPDLLHKDIFMYSGISTLFNNVQSLNESDEQFKMRLSHIKGGIADYYTSAFHSIISQHNTDHKIVYYCNRVDAKKSCLSIHLYDAHTLIANKYMFDFQGFCDCLAVSPNRYHILIYDSISNKLFVYNRNVQDHKMHEFNIGRLFNKIDNLPFSIYAAAIANDGKTIALIDTSRGCIQCDIFQIEDDRLIWKKQEEKRICISHMDSKLISCGFNKQGTKLGIYYREKEGYCSDFANDFGYYFSIVPIFKNSIFNSPISKCENEYELLKYILEIKPKS